MNLFYLIGGILSIFLSGAHTFWGKKFIFTEVKKSNLSEVTKVGFHISWHQTAMVLLISGLALIIISLFDSIVVIDILALFITILIIGNFLVFIIISTIKHRELLVQSIPQMFFFTLMIFLIFLGIIF